MMSVTVVLFVFRVNSLLKESWVLGHLLSMIEIKRWSVSMTSIISASDLLKFFTSSVFTVFGLLVFCSPLFQLSMCAKIFN